MKFVRKCGAFLPMQPKTALSLICLYPLCASQACILLLSAAGGAVAQAVSNDPAGFYNPSEAPRSHALKQLTTGRLRWTLEWGVALWGT